MNDPIQALRDAGYHVVTDRPVSKRLNAFVKLTMMQQEYYRDPLIVRLLSNAQLRKGNALTADQLIRAVKPGENSERFIKAATAISKAIFQRGYSLECPDCGMVDWYPLYDMIINSSGAPLYHFVCRGFTHPFPLPINAQIEYKLNPLVSEAVKDGGLTLLNALVYLNQEVHPSERFQDKFIAVEVKNRHLHTDIDLIRFHKNGGYYVECKDNFNTTDEAIAELQRTIETGLMLANTLGYQYVFATLQEEVPPTIQQQLDAANARLLTAHDLLKPYDEQ
ncbi:MAG: hypothetical protein H6670_03350 [Anaerolineaceae bacterium]|nr:hypothetical protein [Anaerolineaceae bacterium]